MSPLVLLAGGLHQLPSPAELERRDMEAAETRRVLVRYALDDLNLAIERAAARIEAQHGVEA